MAKPTCEIRSVWSWWPIGEAVHQWQCKSNRNIEFTRLRLGHVCGKDLYNFGSAVSVCSKKISFRITSLILWIFRPNKLLVPPETQSNFGIFLILQKKACPWPVESQWSTSKIFESKNRPCINRTKWHLSVLPLEREPSVRWNECAWSKVIEEFF
jgi:hypothetical protein